MLIGGSEAIGQAAGIIRRLIILRTIGLENYGIAIPMLLVLGLLNRLLEINPGTTLVQDRMGGTRRFRDALQFVQVLRGGVYFLIVILLAVPLAVFNDLDEREYVMGFMFVGLIPLTRGLCHIDVHRQLRRRKFEATALSTTVNPVISTIMVSILCLFMSSFWVPLIGRFIDSINAVIMSFVVSKRRYRMRYDHESTIRIIKFTLPLIIGGLVVFLAQHGGEQLVSASQFLFGYSISKVEVGTLAAGVMLAMMPGRIGSKLITQVFSPKIAEIKRRGRNLAGLFEQIQGFAFTLGAATVILLQGGSVIIPILLTERFEAVGPFLVALSLFGALRISGASTRAFALGMGQSKIIMYANIWTLAGLVGSVWVVYAQRSLLEIAYCMAFGEILATLVRCILLKRIIPDLSSATLFFKPAFVLACAFGVGLVQRALIHDLSMPLSILVIIASIAVGAGLLSLVWSSNRRMIARKMFG